MGTEQQVMLMTPTALWQAALDQLRLLLPEATFTALFADSAGGIDGEGGLLIQVSSIQSKEWIEARLSSHVQDALSATGYQGSIRFAVQKAPPSPTQLQSDRLPLPGPDTLKPGDVAFSFLNFDLYARGWLRTPSYYELFWQPILGHVAYAYWRLMQVLYWSKATAQYTRRVRLDIQDSAASLGVSRDLVRGKPARGLGGALKTLQDHHLADVELHAAGRASLYTASFHRHMPLLTPSQVAQLTPSQQQQHLDWMLAAGLDTRLWQSLSDDYATFIIPQEAIPPPELEPFIHPAWESAPLAAMGFLRTPVYYDLFLQPLIGADAYAIWRVCKVLNWSTGNASYTQDTVTSVYALASILNCHRQKITGVKRRKNGVAYWQDGAFDRLRQERLALIHEEGSGSQLAYRLLVVNEPPLLCPSQMASFPERLQLAHREWLRKAQLQIEEWQQLDFDSLLELVE